MAKNQVPIEEVLYGIFYDLFRLSGSSLNPTQTEQLRLRCERLSIQLRRMMQKEAVGVTSKLQEATKEAFLQTDKELKARDARLVPLEEKVKTLSRQRFEIETDVTELRKELKNLDAKKADR